MNFHLGKPLFVMLIVMLISGGIVLSRTEQPRTDLSMWVFAISHADQYRGGDEEHPPLTQLFREKFGQSVTVNLINGRALDTRLLSLMMSGATGDKVPDVVELEIGSIGKYFRFPPEKVGLLPLDKYLDRDGLRDRLVQARLAPWSRGGSVFGIPHDVHPVTITYRKDLFDAAGVDLAACRTWDEFHDACLKYQEYWRANGHPERTAMELPPVNSDIVVRMLLQRGINVVDSDLKTHLTDPRVAETVVMYAEMVSGPRRIGTNASPGGFNWVGDLRKGVLGAFMTPDWRITYIRSHAGEELPGNLRMIPLPVFEEGNHPTSTWGGTMLGIPRNARDPEASWQVIKFFVASPEGLDARARKTDILSPIRDAWDDPSLHAPDPLFGGQKVGELYIRLAEEVPVFHATPFTTTAMMLLAETIYEQTTLIGAGLDRGARLAAAKKKLAEQDEYLRRVIGFTAFE